MQDTENIQDIFFRIVRKDNGKYHLFKTDKPATKKQWIKEIKSALDHFHNSSHLNPAEEKEKE